MAVSTTKLHDGDRIATYVFVNADTDESASPVSKIDISSAAAIAPRSRLNTQPTSLRILRIWYTVSAQKVDLMFGAATNQVVWTLGADSDGYLDFRSSGGIPPIHRGASVFNGDFLLQTGGATGRYSIKIEFEKRYDEPTAEVVEPLTSTLLLTGYAPSVVAT